MRHPCADTSDVKGVFGHGKTPFVEGGASCFAMPPTDPAPPPFPDSICHQCVHHRLVPGARSVFIHCDAPDLPKYPPQPVARCAAFARRPL
jgi:hypothetical protein